MDTVGKLLGEIEGTLLGIEDSLGPWLGLSEGDSDGKLLGWVLVLGAADMVGKEDTVGSKDTEGGRDGEEVGAYDGISEGIRVGCIEG